MVTPLPVPVRQRIVALAQQQLYSATALAQRLDLNPRTVRHFLHEVHQRGDDALRCHYDTQPHHACALPEGVRDQVLALALEHPTWGGPFLLLQFGRLQPQTPLPSVRTVQRWLRPLRPQPAAPGRRPPRPQRTAQGPHDLWQVDAVDQLRLASGELVSWMRIADEYTGAFLGTRVFPLRPFQSRAAAAGASVCAAAVAALGTVAGAAVRSRQSLGFVERSAPRAGVVVGGPGTGGALE